MKKIFFITLTALLLVNFAFSQTYRYNIVSNGQIVGKLTATQTIGGNKINNSEDQKASGGDQKPLSKNQKTISIKSEFDVHLFIVVHVEYDMDCKYTDGILVESSVETYKGDNLHSSTKGEKIDDTYKSIRDGDESIHNGAISYSGAMLYFKEPKGITHVFSEIHAIDKPVTEVNTNHFKISDPNTGHTNQYFYKDGILQKAVIDHSLFSFSMVLIK